MTVWYRDEKLAGRCNCEPARNGRVCKHMAAVLFQWKDMTDLVDKVEKHETLQLGTKSAISFATDTFVDSSLPFYRLIRSEVRLGEKLMDQMMSKQVYYLSGRDLLVKNRIILSGSGLDRFYTQELGKDVPVAGVEAEQPLRRDRKNGDGCRQAVKQRVHRRGMENGGGNFFADCVVEKIQPQLCQHGNDQQHHQHRGKTQIFRVKDVLKRLAEEADAGGNRVGKVVYGVRRYRHGREQDADDQFDREQNQVCADSHNAGGGSVGGAHADILHIRAV